MPRATRDAVYDLILRDATIVTSAGREVADVAIQDGKIRYVGPRPPKRRTKDEISAIGRFLMPGVIDTGVQFEPNGDPTLWERESRAAVSGGVTTVLALPGGDQPVIDRESAKKRIDRVSASSWVDFGLWGAATTDNVDEIAAAVTEGLIPVSYTHLTLPTTLRVAMSHGVLSASTNSRLSMSRTRT